MQNPRGRRKHSPFVQLPAAWCGWSVWRKTGVREAGEGQGCQMQDDDTRLRGSRAAGVPGAPRESRSTLHRESPLGWAGKGETEVGRASVRIQEKEDEQGWGWDCGAHSGERGRVRQGQEERAWGQAVWGEGVFLGSHSPQSVATTHVRFDIVPIHLPTGGLSDHLLNSPHSLICPSAPLGNLRQLPRLGQVLPPPHPSLCCLHSSRSPCVIPLGSDSSFPLFLLEGPSDSSAQCGPPVSFVKGMSVSQPDREAAATSPRTSSLHSASASPSSLTALQE